VKKIVVIGTGRMAGPSRQQSQYDRRTLFQSAGAVTVKRNEESHD
jgi:hypothetical protein